MQNKFNSNLCLQTLIQTHTNSTHHFSTERKNQNSKRTQMFLPHETKFEAKMGFEKIENRKLNIMQIGFSNPKIF